MKKNSKPSKSELRRQAEEKLSRQKQAAQPEQGVDTLRLVHELEVHQIELEMQNEELVQARAELEAVLRQYTDLYDFAPTGYFTLTREGAIRQANLAGANLLGVNPSDLTRRRLGIFVSSESLPAYNVFFEQLLTGQGKINCELAFEKKGDGVLWGRVEATCFEGGEMCRVMLTDITERKQMDQALQESETRYRELIEFAVDGILLGSHEGIIIGANSHMLNLTGRTLDNLIGKHISVLFKPGELKSNPLKFDLLHKQKTVINERNLVRPDGKIVPIEMHTKMMPDGTYQSIYHDITERKQTEEALRTAGQQWQDTFNAIGDSIALMDTDGIIIRHNRAMSTWIGKPACEIDGHLCHEVVHGHSEHIKNCPFQRMKKSKHREKLIFELNGRQINATVDPILNSDGKIIGATHIISDITERLQMQKALQSSESSLKAIFENSQQSFVLIDKNRTIQSFNGNANKNAKALFGHEIQPGESIYKIISPQEHAEFDENFERALAGDTIRVEKMFEVETGALWFEFHYAPVLTHREISGVFLSTFNITERKQAEELLKESEWRNRIISELTTDYIFVVDVDAGGTLRIRWASDNFSLLTGRKIEDVATSNVWGNIIHPDDKVRFFDFINQVLSTAKTDKIECRTISPHGGERWVRVFVRPQAYEGNKVATVIGAVEDITERKRVEDALRESEEKFRSLVEQSTDGVILIDEEGIIIEWNTAQSKITGIPRASALGAAFWDIQHQIMIPEHRMKMTHEYLKKTYFESNLSEIVDYSEKPRDIEIVSLSGEHKFLQQTSFIIKTEKGHRMGTVIRDITEHKRVYEALRVSEERFRLLTNNIPDIIYSLNGEGNIVTINSSAFERYGYTEQDAKGKPFLSFIHPEDHGIVITSFLKALEEQRKFTHGLQFRIVAENGISYWFELNSQARYDSQAQYIGEEGVLRDITERKRVEDALHESEARNRAMVDALPDLIFVQDRAGVYLDYRAKMSHLLITPPEFFLGRSTREILPPDQAEAFQQKSYLAFQTGEIQIHEYVLELEDGIHHFEARMNAYDNDRLLSIVREITERKLAEVELQYTKVGLEKANKELQTALIREKELAHTDALTGINNRRYLYELAEHEFEIALRYQRPLSILMFDIDHFKRVNDTFGHTTGDRILQQVTQVTCAKLRSADVIGRYGGEEFVIILPMTNAQQAYPLAERIRLAAEAIRVPTEKGDATITLSIGIVEIRQGTQQTGSVESMIRRADEVMYAAKQAGRNRTEIGD